MTGLGMRTVAAAFVTSILGVSTLSATTFAEKTFTCPLDGAKFAGKTVASTNTFNGIDSDFCPWPKGAMALPAEVQVCPTDFYAGLNDYFNLDLPSAMKEKLRAALENWREKRPDIKTVDDLAPAQRWELTAVCATVKHNDARQMAEIWLRAAWTQRQSGLADFGLEFGDPITAFEVVGDTERDIERAKKPEEKVELRFQVVMGSHRAGDVVRRNKAVAALEGETLDEKQKVRLDALKASFAVEAEYQKQALAAYVRAIEEEAGAPKDRAVYQFLVGDINRRLGNKAQAVEALKKLQTMGDVRPDIKDLADFMIDLLAAD